MLKKERQQKKFNKAWQSMLAHLLAFCETQKPEDLHRFRVQVKKIKALLLFLQGRSAPKQLQSIFRHAGKIRSAHIHLRLLEQYQLANVELKVEQEKIAKTEARRFCSKHRFYIKKLKKTEQSLSGNFCDIDDKSILKLYRNKLEKLSRFFSKNDTSIDKAHENRKKIKNLLYLYNALPTSLALKLQLNTAYLNQVQDAIGQWNDIVSIEELLKKEGFSDKKTIGKLDRRSRKLYAAVRALSDDFERKVILPET